MTLERTWNKMMVDRILFNGNIITLDERQPAVSALAIWQGRIVAVGDDDFILSLSSAKTTKHNLNGVTVIPGLIDAHIHWEWTARAMQAVDLFEVPSKDEALRRVAERVVTLGPGDWVLGRGWAQDIWPDRQFPSAVDLDRVAPDNPCFFQAKSGHAAWVNSVALKLANIDAQTPDPEGGRIVRDHNGQPTGVLLETAIALVGDLVPAPTPDQLADAMLKAQERAHAAGLTGIHDFDDPSALVALQVMRERGQLGLRVVKQINQRWLDAALESGIRSGFGDHWLRFGNLKLFSDGALGPRTALMVEPYENEPDNYGIAVLSKDEMTELASRASAFGIATTIHAIGDRAVHDVLDVFQIVRGEESRRGDSTAERRHRIEHVQIIHPSDKHRLAELDIIASMQPIHATSDWEVADRWWGRRAEWAYNARLQIDQRVKFAFGSDSPIEPFEPLLGIYAAVTRQTIEGRPEGGWYPELRLTMDEALRGYTVGAAYAGRMEAHQGRLMPGLLADLVVLDRDLYVTPPEELLQTQIIGTMVDGVWRYGGVA